MPATITTSNYKETQPADRFMEYLAHQDEPIAPQTKTSFSSRLASKLDWRS